MLKEFNFFKSFEAAEASDRATNQSMSAAERLSILLSLIEQYGSIYYGPVEGFERVYKITKLSQS